MASQKIFWILKTPVSYFTISVQTAHSSYWQITLNYIWFVKAQWQNEVHDLFPNLDISLIFRCGFLNNILILWEAESLTLPVQWCSFCCSCSLYFSFVGSFIYFESLEILTPEKCIFTFGPLHESSKDTESGVCRVRIFVLLCLPYTLCVTLSKLLLFDSASSSVKWGYGDICNSSY